MMFSTVEISGKNGPIIASDLDGMNYLGLNLVLPALYT